jgi:hypothetical protein
LEAGESKLDEVSLQEKNESDLRPKGSDRFRLHAILRGHHTSNCSLKFGADFQGSKKNFRSFLYIKTIESFLKIKKPSLEAL